MLANYSLTTKAIDAARNELTYHQVGDVLKYSTFAVPEKHLKFTIKMRERKGVISDIFSPTTDPNLKIYEIVIRKISKAFLQVDYLYDQV